MSEQPLDEQPIEPDVHIDDPAPEPEEQPDMPQDDL
jgi:hypothetical protein